MFSDLLNSVLTRSYTPPLLASRDRQVYQCKNKSAKNDRLGCDSVHNNTEVDTDDASRHDHRCNVVINLHALFLAEWMVSMGSRHNTDGRSNSHRYVAECDSVLGIEPVEAKQDGNQRATSSNATSLSDNEGSDDYRAANELR